MSTPQVLEVSLAQVRDRSDCDVEHLPEDLSVLAWDATSRTWSCANVQSWIERERVGLITRYLSRLGAAHDRSWWTLVCLRDALGEHGAESLQHSRPFSPTRPLVLCYGCRRDDPHGVVMPEAHYFMGHRYAKPRVQLTWERRPWRTKLPSGIFAGGDHGTVANFLDPTAGLGETPRRRLATLARELELPLVVAIGSGVSRRAQIAHRVVIDVDGFARTWDAWAWKVMSGSVLLAQESVWSAFFNDQFVAWEHFVPVRNDFSDLAEQLDWCLTHDAESRAIAQRARRHRRTVYRPRNVDARFRPSLDALVRGDPVRPGAS